MGAHVFLVKDRPALRSHLERLAAEPGLERILVSHHLPVSEMPAEILSQVATSLG